MNQKLTQQITLQRASPLKIIQLLNSTYFNSVKLLTQRVCFSYWSDTEQTKNELSKIANTERQFYLLVNY